MIRDFQKIEKTLNYFYCWMSLWCNQKWGTLARPLMRVHFWKGKGFNHHSISNQQHILYVWYGTMNIFTTNLIGILFLNSYSVALLFLFCLCDISDIKMNTCIRIVNKPTIFPTLTEVLYSNENSFNQLLPKGWGK